MSTVQEIEAVIPNLPPTDLVNLRAWFDAYFAKQLELTGEIKTENLPLAAA